MSLDFISGFGCGLILLIIVLICCVLKKDCKPETRVYPLAIVTYENPQTPIPLAIVVE